MTFPLYTLQEMAPALLPFNKHREVYSSLNTGILFVHSFNPSMTSVGWVHKKKVKWRNEYGTFSCQSTFNIFIDL